MSSGSIASTSCGPVLGSFLVTGVVTLNEICRQVDETNRYMDARKEFGKFAGLAPTPLYFA